ncbi:uncharacterized protein CCDC198 [Cephus cinctus]|uniref:Uncharacterized protein CCDC198 n=1 Tax=Cephus cinctus TaxID=211228 RepID=A0AAJ7CGK1_CEPCN|nr:uncharacterized protein CCDC198 [Cephus cinctus]
MGCGTSSEVMPSAAPLENGKVEKSVKNGESTPRRRGSPLAFEVPIRDGESLVRKHPPMRFQRLEEQQLPQPEITLQLLQKRQAEAEERRRRILDLRVQSAQHFQQKIRTVA